MTYEQAMLMCIGIVFTGVIGAIVVSYVLLFKFQKSIIADLMRRVEAFTLIGLALTGSKETGHPMTGPAALQQLAKLREAEGESPVEDVSVPKANQPRPGVTIRQQSGV